MIWSTLRKSARPKGTKRLAERIVNAVGDGLVWCLVRLLAAPRKRVTRDPDGSTWISRDRSGELPRER